MKFGHLHDISNVDFTLPPQDPQNKHLKQNLKTKETTVFLGLPIWYNKKWEGKVYPQGVARRKCLHHYCQQFNAIEFNSPHYHIPDAKMIESWIDQATPGFTFCPKFYQKISHDYQLQNCNGLIETFIKRLTLFKDHLGLSFLQLPPSFSLAQFKHLERFLSLIDESFSLAIEFRHPSWFDENHLHPQAFELLRRFQTATVVTDVAGNRNVLHSSLTSNQVMVRFVGHHLDEGNYSRLEQWIERLQEWMALGVEQIYFFIHTPDNDSSPELGYYFIEQWNKKGIVKMPPAKSIRTPVQLSFF